MVVIRAIIFNTVSRHNQIIRLAMANFVEFIIYSRFRTIIIAGILGGLSQLMLPLSLLSLAIVALFILRKGEREGGYVLFGTAAVIVVMSFFIASRPGFTYPLVILLLLPVYICAVLLRLTAAQGVAVAAAGVCAAVFAIAIQLFSGDAVTWWSTWLKTAVQGVPGATYQDFQDNGSLLIMNGLIPLMLGLTAVASVLLGRWLQSLGYNPGEFRKEFYALKIPKAVVSGNIALLAVTAMFNQRLMIDVLIVSTLMYFFQGLAVLHYAAAKKKSGILYLAPPYFLLTVAPHYVIVGMACVGVTDILLNFRKLPAQK